MKKFEYKSIPYARLAIRNGVELDIFKLDTLGEEGWEFVTVQGGMCIFKREVGQ